MRSPHDMTAAAPRAERHRGRFWLIVALVVLVVLVVSAHSLATIYTDFLWFASVKESPVWRTLAVTKIGLFVVFAAVFFVALWANLAIVDRLSPGELVFGPEDELVRRYQQTLGRHAFMVRTIVAVIVAGLAATSAIGEWQNWLYFRHGVPFGVKDPQFHRDVGWYVFKLPFESFVVNWAFASLIIIVVVTAVAHYLNGGIHVQGGAPRVAPTVKVHLSVLLALVALVKAAAYYLQRFSLDFSSSGYVQGAGYTDVHARLPAYELLFYISLLAAVILIYNVRQRGWALPALAVGLWAFVAVIVGAIYPAIVQQLKVNPAQYSLEKPYIDRNISATRAAYNLEHVQVKSFAGDQAITTPQLNDAQPSLNDVRLWDPDPNLTGPTYIKNQALRSYYTFTTQSLDRYNLSTGGQGATPTPVMVAVRQANSQDLPAQGWINTHLQYTHGYGMIVSPANQQDVHGNPVYDIEAVPPQSSNNAPVITQPNVYFGYQMPGYVVVNTKQPELDYQDVKNNNNHESKYGGAGGVQLSSFWTKAAFAIRFADINLLISDQVTPNSRIMFVRDIQTMVTKTAPFLSLDSDPYPVIIDGRIEWVQDAYTTTDHYPYSQDADVSAVSPNSGLPQTFNYIRNSVKVVIDAYSGKMTFYAMTTTDPILTTWERIFPNMFTPAKDMPTALRDHLRYPEDIFTVQSAIYGKYHLTPAGGPNGQPTAFYNAAGGWALSQNGGSGSPSKVLPRTSTTNSQGQSVVGGVQRMAPIYQEQQLPGQSGVGFTIMEAYVPISAADNIQTLSAFMVGQSDYPNYGDLTVYETQSGQSVPGPFLADSEMASDTNVSSQISLLNQNGSNVVLGNLLMIPVGQSMLYARPLYVQSSSNTYPLLRYVIMVYGGQVAFKPTVMADINALFPNSAGPPPSSNTGPPTVTGPSSNQIKLLIAAADQLYKKIQDDLQRQDLGAYQTDVKALGQVITKLQALESQPSKSASKGTSPPTTSTTNSTAATVTPSSSTSVTPTSNPGTTTTTARA